MKTTSGTPVIVSDSSTLIHLSAIGRLDLLRDFFERLTLPPAVWREVVEQGKGRPGVREIEAGREDGWIEVRQPTNELLLRSLKRHLDEGEAEAICLAVEHRATLVLLDESAARKVAADFDLAKTGAIGILIRAKLEGRIARLQGELDQLRGRAGFWIEPGLYRRALAAVGEDGPDEA